VPTQVGDNAAGVKQVSEILTAATTARWPMYLRNVKQILRAAGGFDERRYGFSGLIDLLRACQRDGWIRLERDRRGGLRVFQGPELARIAPPAPRPAPPGPAPVETADLSDLSDISDSLDESPDESQIEIAAAFMEPQEQVIIDTEPVAVVDTTAELLGRAKPKRPRARAGSGTGHGHSHAAAVSRTRKTATKRAASSETRRTTRPRKRASGNGSDK
jgi:hypothetical protein